MILSREQIAEYKECGVETIPGKDELRVRYENLLDTCNWLIGVIKGIKSAPKKHGPEGRQLSKAGREQLAMALLLLKDWKTGGDGVQKFNVEIVMMIFGLADGIGVRKEFDELLSKIPPMRITPR